MQPIPVDLIDTRAALVIAFGMLLNESGNHREFSLAGEQDHLNQKVNSDSRLIGLHVTEV